MTLRVTLAGNRDAAMRFRVTLAGTFENRDAEMRFL
jgi:hypothetical protein